MNVPVRGNVKSKSHAETKAQWKDKIRKGCLERAKDARKKRLLKSRQALQHGGGDDDDNDGGADADGLDGQRSNGFNNKCGIADRTVCRVRATDGTIGKRGREEGSHGTPEWNEFNNNNGASISIIVDRTPVDNTNEMTSDALLAHRESGDSNENAVATARTLVERELQRALTGLRHCNKVRPPDGGVPWKKATSQHDYGAGEWDSSEFMGGNELAEVQGMEEEVKEMEDEYKISKEEFEELLNDVTEELEREDELLEEELWEMERAEAMERERLMHQIDDFECWEEFDRQQEEEKQHSQPNTYASPMANDTHGTPLVTCPICHSAPLKETPRDGIGCANAAMSSGIRDNDKCTFRLDIAHEGLTLNHLQSQLRAVYEEHSRACPKGKLQFRMENRVGMNMLMAKCDVCSCDVVVL